MAVGNSITIVGNLTRDPELRETPSGTSVAQFSIASNRSYKRGDEWEEETTFVDVTVWKDLAEHVVASLEKGNEVIVIGRLDQERWEDKDGGNRSKHVIVADHVGASLRWATVAVTKVTGGGNKGGGSKPSRPAPEAPAEDPF